MKILFGKEITRELKFKDEKEHKISLEDDNEYKEIKIEPEIVLVVPGSDSQKIIKFIRDVQILGVDNEAVKLMHTLKEELIKKVEDRQAEKIINNQH